ncbi:MAG: threonine synthase [Flavihumibacter sp.]
MEFYSLTDKRIRRNFKEATIEGQAPDGGLYFPSQLATLPAGFNWKHASKEEMAYQLVQPYVGDSLREEVLRRIVRETIDFPFPLVPVYDDLYALELFHGPTLAFKDTGARFMSRCLGEFAATGDRKITVLVATSGDTGGAVASGFHHVNGVEVVILYPSGKVSPVQEKQLTTLGGNIRALEVQGNFDDCQQMVKTAFKDPDLKKALFLTSANSINVARWLPQQFYYAFALQQWIHEEPPVFVVPSGNFGNICAGIMAWKAGLPVKHFVAACNENDVVPRYLLSGRYEPAPAVATISNAMDVGSPSNFTRISEIFGDDISAMRAQLSGYRTTDAATKARLAETCRQTGYIADPHGAVAIDAFFQYKAAGHTGNAIFLETAHPIKFPEVVEEIIGQRLPIPETVAGIMSKPKVATLLPNSYAELKAYLLG